MTDTRSIQQTDQVSAQDPPPRQRHLATNANSVAHLRTSGAKLPCPITVCRAPHLQVDQSIRHVEAHLVDDLNEQQRAAIAGYAASFGWILCPCGRRFARGGKSHCASCNKSAAAGLISTTQAPPPPVQVTPPRTDSQVPQHPQNTTTLPSFHDIFKRQVNTQRRVPHSSVKRFRAIFIYQIKKAVRVNSEESWVELCLFTKCILAPPPRGDANRDTLVTRRLEDWALGHKVDLWNRIPRRAPSVYQQFTADKQIEHGVLNLVSEGSYGRALQRLTSDGIHQPSKEIYEKLLELHPKRRNAIEKRALTSISTDLERLIKDKDVIDAINSFDSMAACGTMGIKSTLLKQMMTEDDSNSFIPTLRSFIIHLGLGRAPNSLRPYLAGGCLNALIKPPKKLGEKPGVRPIAAGELLRRIVAKCLNRTQRHKYDAKFAPHQLGVGAKAGTERIAHLVRLIVKANEESNDFVILKVDAKNAFNLMSRASILLELEEEKNFPELSAWVKWTYENPSILWYADEMLSSDDGVQQGDPLGPLLFALTLHSLVVEVEALRPTLNRWYLDDGIIAGNHDQVSAALKVLQGEKAQKMGFFLNPTKCELIWLKKEHARDDAFPQAFAQRTYDGNFDIVGTPIGDADHTTAYIRKQITQPTEKAWHSLRKIDDAQAAYTILRTCCNWNRITHLMRTIPPDLSEAGAKEFDQHLRSAAASILGLTSCTASQWQQATLPVAKGGLGLRSALAHSAASFIASAKASAELDKYDVKLIPGFDKATYSLEKFAIDHEQFPTSKELSARVDEVIYAQLMRAEVQDRVRLESVADSNSGVWLNAVPNEHFGTKMTTAEFTTAVRWWLGMEVYAHSHLCPTCVTQTCDVKGIHAICCSTANHKTRRHDELVTICEKHSRRGLLCAQREATGVLSGNEKPADLFTRENGKETANDFFVSHPPLPADGAASHLEAYARLRKESIYGRKCLERGVVFRAVGFSTHGVVSAPAKDLIRCIAKAEAQRSNAAETDKAARLWTELMFSLQRSNARAILDRDAPRTSDPENQTLRGPSVSRDRLLARSSSAATHTAGPSHTNNTSVPSQTIILESARIVDLRSTLDLDGREDNKERGE